MTRVTLMPGGVDVSWLAEAVDNHRPIWIFGIEYAPVASDPSAVPLTGGSGTESGSASTHSDPTSPDSRPDASASKGN